MRVREPGVVPDPISEELYKLASRVEEAGEDLDDENKIEFTSLAERARKLADSIRDWLGQKLPGQVYWIEITPATPLIPSPFRTAYGTYLTCFFEEES